jgi:hypothetical protein
MQRKMCPYGIKSMFLRVPWPSLCLSSHCVYNPKSLCVGSNLLDKHHQISPQCSQCLLISCVFLLAAAIAQLQRPNAADVNLHCFPTRQLNKSWEWPRLLWLADPPFYGDIVYPCVPYIVSGRSETGTVNKTRTDSISSNLTQKCFLVDNGLI